MANCGCLNKLMELNEIPGKKGLYQFVPAGRIMNLKTGESLVKPVIYAIRHGKNGYRSLTPHWMPVKFCPACGEEVEAWQELAAPHAASVEQGAGE